MRMHFYSHLYVGEKAGRHRFLIIRNIRRRKLQPDVYVITLAINGNNLLDIYPSVSLLHPYFKEKEMLAVGIAVGYQEAMEVVASIVDEVYQRTGGFDLEPFLEDKKTFRM